ncbi:MAG: hypothetical protein A2901_00375 [Elusimicrobia bacterium RIFCSPLOWO2_01_FULL_54_10]|nr:MAG: hypothetical protein A2901_00375 [Elusimicrobia bacterium RIFCSPLOWO2_01_FULL_54_10]
MTGNPYLRTDEKKEGLKGLEFLLHALRISAKDEYYWKWVIVALLNTIQAFIVCSISGTAGLGALRKDSRVKHLKAYESGSIEIDEPVLDYFPSLYKKMKSELKFASTKEIDDDVEKARRFRNKFIHFTPQAWSLQIVGLPRITKNSLKVVEFLGWKPGHFHWDNNEREKAIKLHNQIIKYLETFH